MEISSSRYEGRSRGTVLSSVDEHPNRDLSVCTEAVIWAADAESSKLVNFPKLSSNMEMGSAGTSAILKGPLA